MNTGTCGNNSEESFMLPSGKCKIPSIFGASLGLCILKYINKCLPRVVFFECPLISQRKALYFVAALRVGDLTSCLDECSCALIF